MFIDNINDNLSPLEYESLTIAGTAVPFTTAKVAPTSSSSGYASTKAVLAHVSVETDSIRYRIDGHDPTASEGHLIPANTSFWVQGITSIENFRAIKVTNNATLKVTYFFAKNMNSFRY